MDYSDIWRGEIVASIALVVLIIILRGLTARAIQQSSLTSEHRRRWLVQVRTGAVLVLVFGIAVIWAAELRTFALSLMAVAVAVAIATKELLLCLSGAVMRTSSRSFTIGDRIQVGTFRGDVIDIGALSTKLLELDELTNRRTGRSISLPNSMFLDKPVLNETFAGRYVLALLSVPLAKGTSWSEAEHQLLQAATEVCAPFLPEATELIIGVSKKEGLDPPVVDPTVTVVAEKADEIKLVLRFPTPVRQSSSVSQQILRRFLEANGEARKAFPATVEQSLEQ